MSTERINILFKRYVEHKITWDEESELLQLLDKASEDDIKEIINECYDELPVNHMLDKADKARIFQVISERSKLSSNSSSAKTYSGSFNKNRFYTSIAATAAVVLILLTATLSIFKNEEEIPVKEINKIVKIEKPVEKPLYKNDIKPGGNKAILILADGTKVVLDDAKNGKLREQGNTIITKLESGTLAYNTKPESPSLEKIVQYNTLTTPRGGKYCITLPDGTIVWLNASTTLRFPVAFTGNTRKVEVKGEAYFEVAKNEDMPFIVKAGNSEIKVLGTHFNVMAYADDKLLKTTLLEGKVEVSVIKKGEGDQSTAVMTLEPGEQAQLDINNSLTVIKADVEEAVAWKNGYFIFKDESIVSIMQKLSRWYDVKVVFESADETILYNANISRANNISEVLRKLEMTETIHFKIDGKIVTVLQ